MKGKILFIIFAIVFAVIFRSGNFSTKVVISIIAFFLFAIYLGRDIFILLRSKGNNIKFSKLELKAKERYSYKTVIVLYVFAICMLGLSIIIGLKSLNTLLISGTLTDSEIFIVALGLIGGLTCVLALIQANHIKYVLYIRKSNQLRNTFKNEHL